MAKDKAKDDSLFNCSQDYEIDYVSDLYGKDSSAVKEFLEDKCNDKTIANSTHAEIYGLIKKELGFSVQ